MRNKELNMIQNVSQRTPFQNEHLTLSKRRALTLHWLSVDWHAFVFLRWNLLLACGFWSPSRHWKGTTKHEFWQEVKAFFYGGHKQMNKQAVFQSSFDLAQLFKWWKPTFYGLCRAEKNVFKVDLLDLKGVSTLLPADCKGCKKKKKALEFRSSDNSKLHPTRLSVRSGWNAKDTFASFKRDDYWDFTFVYAPSSLNMFLM